MPSKVLITPDMFHKDGEILLKEAGYDVQYTSPTRTITIDELRTSIMDADAYIAGSNRVDADTIDLAKRLRLIARFGVGYDSIDWKYSLDNKIPVTITPGTNEQSVADMVFALLLGISRKIPYFDRSIREANWTPQVLGHEIWSKTIGIIGTGRIGKAVAKRAKGFDMTTLAFDAYPDSAWANELGVQYVDLEQLLSQSDYLSLHLPLTKQTHRLVNNTFLQQMKSSAFLINTARGQLVDEEALHHALLNRTIAGAALDVFTKEPLAKNHQLLEVDNCLLTCHISSHTEEAMRRMSVLCAEEIIRTGKGQQPKHPIPEWNN
ncbi:phosphoglycerate dehydrogenase [Alkalihalobacillus sp. 1P02AB]|uniref:phosphoglycerate dehydrogenase n=1 Tax=Alkalihalobacillus sp. 1P02AB TaxID=3132260 RepID=UPI0039A4B16B